VRSWFAAIASIVLGCASPLATPTNERGREGQPVAAAPPASTVTACGKSNATSSDFPPVAPADLRFTKDARPFFSLDRAGTLRIGDEELGTLGADGVFQYTDNPAEATLTDDDNYTATPGGGGRLVLRGRTLGMGGGLLKSAYVVYPDGNASLPDGSTVCFDEKGRLSDGRAEVEGLTPENRRTAMFVYLLVRIHLD